MEIVTLTCKKCGAKITVSKERQSGFCSYCGTEYYFAPEEREGKNSEFNFKGNCLETYEGKSACVKIPAGTLYIANNAFKGMNGIEEVILPNGLKEIGESAFEDCFNLKRTEFPESLEKIQKRAFKNSGLQSAAINMSIIDVGEEAFAFCNNLKSVKIEKGFTRSMKRTFKHCLNLEEVDCDLSDFFPSFKASVETYENFDNRPTFFDTFQATPFLDSLYRKCIVDKVCVYCGGELKKSLLSRKLTCKQCEKKYQY